VPRGALYFVDPTDREARGAFYLVDGVAGDRAHVGVDLADSDLDVEPLLESVFVCPNRAHLGPRVSFNHIVSDQWSVVSGQWKLNQRLFT
jgi:hypothetical protein